MNHPDTRDYYANVSDIERYISLGSDPRVRDMRMEYYEVQLLPGGVIFRVAVNSKSPLPIGEEMTVWCTCNVSVKPKKLPWKKWVDIIAGGYPSAPFKQAKILPRDDYAYDDAYGYLFEIVFMGDELCRNPIRGFYNVRFSIEVAAYLRKGRVQFNRFQVDELA